MVFIFLNKYNVHAQSIITSATEPESHMHVAIIYEDTSLPSGELTYCIYDNKTREPYETGQRFGFNFSELFPFSSGARRARYYTHIPAAGKSDKHAPIKGTSPTIDKINKIFK